MKSVKTKAKNFFGAKTLYMYEVTGASKVKKHKPDTKFIMIEERVVLFEAKDFESAIKKAEKEAKAYESTHTNPYKQKVKIKYLNCVDVYEVYDDLENGCEVYSTTNLVKKTELKKNLLDIHFGVLLKQKEEIQIRTKFLNIEYSQFKDEK